MCGIVGCSLNRPLTQEDIGRMRAIRDGLAHRGPDDKGEFFDQQHGIFLGHRRLSIVDLDPRSAQPMQNENHVIVYNGEIYNYRTLQKDFESLRTTGDTEIVLKGWEKWGLDVVDKFDGMFAFAIWDGKTINLVTDFFGEKPLYLYENADGIYFSSEANPLIAAFNPAFKPSEEELSDLLYLGYIRPPRTGFKGLKNIPAAQNIILNQGKIQAQKTYWHPEEPHVGTGKIAPIGRSEIDTIRDILCQSLQDRLFADVPVGLFLSGGVDSSLVAALAARELNLKPKAYTVAFPDGKDESLYAQKIAQSFEISHTIIDSTQNDTWREAPRHLAEIYGVPNDNMTALAVYQMCMEAKKYLTVAISGLGGDEIFYGYNKYRTAYAFRNYYRSAKILAPVSGIAKNFSSKIALLHDLVRGTPDRQYLRIKNSAEQNVIEGLWKKMPENILPSWDGDLVYALQNYDLMMSMPQSFIPAIDRASMRASVEVRTPFLSRKLLSYVSTLDQRSLIAYGQKNVLKTLLGRYMDLSLLYQGKQGFVYPAGRYYRECNPPQPRINGLADEAIKKIWAQKEKLALQQLVIRLSLLDHFYRHGYTQSHKKSID